MTFVKNNPLLTCGEGGLGKIETKSSLSGCLLLRLAKGDYSLQHQNYCDDSNFNSS